MVVELPAQIVPGYVAVTDTPGEGESVAVAMTEQELASDMVTECDPPHSPVASAVFCAGIEFQR